MILINRLVWVSLVLRLPLVVLMLTCGASATYAAEIWVSPAGSDANPGTRDRPKATPAAALRQARELRRLGDLSIRGGIHIILRGGEYFLTETLVVRPEDSGTEDSPTIFEAAPGEKPLLSGGVEVTGWKREKADVWFSDVRLSSRQLWVDGQKVVRARDVDKDDQMKRILSIDRASREIVIAAPGGMSAANMEPGQMEMVIHQMWATAVLRIKKIVQDGANWRLSFYEPESRIEFEHPWPAIVIDSAWKQNGNSAYYLSNHLSFLNKPGEWYEDIVHGRLYLKAKPLNVRMPVLTNILQVSGVADRPVSHVRFQGIAFSYAGWTRPSEAGHVPLQAGMFLLDGYKLKVPGTPDKKGLENQAWIGRPPGGVELSYTHGVCFELCEFSHMGSTGLDIVRGSSGDSVINCRFSDIGGTAIQVGVYSDPGFETHLPYDPADKREVCTNDYIGNNLVTDCTNEDWGCVGISAGYVSGIRIVHNEVSEVSYSGICVGWGWTKTTSCMRNNLIMGNYVHHYAKHMYDVGGIYTLSAQPGTVISGNRIDSIYHPSYVHDPKHWFYFYLDEGSSYITIRDNWCPEEKVMRNANGPGNVWERNGPMVAEDIKNAAGLEPTK